MKCYRQSDATDQSIRAHGCGPVAGLSALSWATDGEYAPQDMTAAAKFRVRQSGATDKEFNARGLTSDELSVSMHAVKATDVVMDLPVQQRSGVKVSDLLAQMNRDGTGALVAVNYAKVQDAGKGVGSYRGFHWVFVFEPDDGFVKVADPLRRQVITWPIDLLTRAMETFGISAWGDGRGEAVVVNKRLSWRQGYNAKRTQLDAANKALGATKRALDSTKAALETCQASQGGDVAAARARGIADAAERARTTV